MIGYPWSITHTLQSAEHSSVPLILKKPNKVACDGTTESEKVLFTIVFLWFDVFRKTTGVDMSVCVLIVYTTVVFTVSSSTLLTCRRNKLHRNMSNKTKTCLYGGQLVSLDFLHYWFYIKRDLCLRRFWTQQWFPRQGNE